jgi:hypothetical protein
MSICENLKILVSAVVNIYGIALGYKGRKESAHEKVLERV